MKRSSETRLSPPSSGALLGATFWAFSAFLIVKSFFIPLLDPDLWWHLAAGRFVVENHRFLRMELFSHTLPGTRWINFEWLFEVFAYEIYRWRDLSGIYAAKILACLAVVAMTAVAIRRSGARGALGLLLVWISFLVLRPRLFERAELITFFFMAGLTWLVQELRFRRKAPRPITYAGVFLAFVIWVNMHGGFVYGIILLACFSVGARLSRDDRNLIPYLDRFLVVALAAMLLNPWGPSLIAVHLEHLVEFRGLQRDLQEWTPPLLKTAPYFWILVALSWAAIITDLIRGRSRARFWLPSVLAFPLWGGTSIRHTALLGAFAACSLGESLVEFLSEKRNRRSREAAVWILLLTLLAAHLRLARVPVPSEKVDWSRVPRGAAAFLDRRNITGSLYNSYGFGGYLEWSLGPRLPVFMDGRYLFLPFVAEENRLNRNMAFGLSPAPWQTYFAKWDIDLAVVEYPTAFYRVPGSDFQGLLPATSLMFPRDRWALVYWDDTALVFVRRNKKKAELIQSAEYRLVRPYSLPQMKYLLEKNLISWEETQREMERQRRENGPTKIGFRLEKLLEETKINRPGGGLKNQ